MELLCKVFNLLDQSLIIGPFVLSCTIPLIWPNVASLKSTFCPEAFNVFPGKFGFSAKPELVLPQLFVAFVPLAKA